MGMGWMALYGLLGLIVFGIVVYVAVKLATDHRHHGGDDRDEGGHCC